MNLGDQLEEPSITIYPIEEPSDLRDPLEEQVYLRDPLEEPSESTRSIRRSKYTCDIQ